MTSNDAGFNINSGPNTVFDFVISGSTAYDVHLDTSSTVDIVNTTYDIAGESIQAGSSLTRKCWDLGFRLFFARALS